MAPSCALHARCQHPDVFTTSNASARNGTGICIAESGGTFPADNTRNTPPCNAVTLWGSLSTRPSIRHYVDFLRSRFFLSLRGAIVGSILLLHFVGRSGEPSLLDVPLLVPITGTLLPSVIVLWAPHTHVPIQTLTLLHKNRSHRPKRTQFAT